MTLLSSASEESIENPTVSVQNVELFGVFGKPNAIVRPVRRMEPNEESMHTVEMTTVPVNSMEPTDASIDMYHFTKHLEVKLKNLQSDKRMTSKIVIILTFCLFNTQTHNISTYIDIYRRDF